MVHALQDDWQARDGPKPGDDLPRQRWVDQRGDVVGKLEVGVGSVLLDETVEVAWLCGGGELERATHVAFTSTDTWEIDRHTDRLMAGCFGAFDQPLRHRPIAVAVQLKPFGTWCRARHLFDRKGRHRGKHHDRSGRGRGAGGRMFAVGMR